MNNNEFKRRHEQTNHVLNRSTKLTFDEQQEMIINNTRLIYRVIYNLGYYSRLDDLYDAGLIGLVKGVRVYEKNRKAKTSTFLYKCIKYEILNQLNYEKKDILFNPQIIHNLNNTEEEYKNDDNFFPDNYNLEKEVMIKDIYKKIISLLNSEKDIHREIFCKYYGLNCLQKSPEELVEIYKIPYSTIRVIIFRIRKKIIKQLTKMYNN